MGQKRGQKSPPCNRLSCSDGENHAKARSDKDCEEMVSLRCDVKANLLTLLPLLLAGAVGVTGCTTTPGNLALGSSSIPMEFRRIAENDFLEMAAGTPLIIGYSFDSNGIIYSLSNNARAGGLRLGDVLVSANGQSFSGQREFPSLTSEPQTHVVRRGGMEKSFQLTPFNRLEAASGLRKSISFGDWNDVIRELYRQRRNPTSISGPLVLTKLMVSALGAVSPNSWDHINETFTMCELILDAGEVSYEAYKHEKGRLLSTLGWLRAVGAFDHLSNVQERMAVLENRRRSAGDLQSPKPAVMSQGTGCFISPEGGILTAYHVVKDATEIMVTTSSGKTFPAVIEKSSPSTDLAILRVYSESVFEFLPIASAYSPKLGEEVFTVGYPYTGLLSKDPKFTDGVVSSLSGGLNDEAHLLQTTVSIQPGSSGGPLVTYEGKLIGVISSTAALDAFFDATGTLPQNVNWAVKIQYANPLVGRAGSEMSSLGRE